MKNIIKILIVPTFCLCICLATFQVFAASESENNDAAPTNNSNNASIQDIQGQMKNIMNEMISVSGAIVSGMAAGMREGAEKAQEQIDSADGVKLIANKEDLAEFLKVKVIRLEEQGKSQWRVTLAIKNTNDFPVRLVNLTRKQSVLILDVDGFAYDPVQQEKFTRTLTVAARAAVKIAFDFVDLEAKPGVIRLFDTDFSVQ